MHNSKCILISQERGFKKNVSRETPTCLSPGVFLGLGVCVCVSAWVDFTGGRHDCVRSMCSVFFMPRFSELCCFPFPV